MEGTTTRQPKQLNIVAQKANKESGVILQRVQRILAKLFVHVCVSIILEEIHYFCIFSFQYTEISKSQLFSKKIVQTKGRC
jgi:hypothetical protein